MDGRDTLSSCLISHINILPGRVAEFLNNVIRKLMENFMDYELAMTEIHQYYDLSLVSYNYNDDMLVLQIPIYVTNLCKKAYKQSQCHVIQKKSLN